MPHALKAHPSRSTSTLLDHCRQKACCLRAQSLSCDVTDALLLLLLLLLLS
jgi:hypothetical protein